MMPETVIVTLRCGEFCRDYALPAHIPLEELYERLLKVLQKSSKEFEKYTSVVLELDGGGMLDRGASLADYGVRSGMYLDIAGEEKYHGLR